MNDFVFHSPTEFIFGRGVEAQAGERIAHCGGHRVLIVCGGGSARRSGLLDQRPADGTGVREQVAGQH